jgi:hypothetical protein
MLGVFLAETAWILPNRRSAYNLCGYARQRPPKAPCVKLATPARKNWVS